MEKISSIRVNFKKTESIELNRLSLFIERVFAEFMSGGTFTGSIQTEDFLHNDITDILDFEGLYSEEGGAQSWQITFSKGNDKIFVSFQQYLRESNVGVATANLDLKRNQRLRNMILEVLDTQIR